MEIYLPLRVSKNNNLSFNLLAVWNFGPTFCQRAFVELVSLFEKSGLKSLYHHYHGLKTEKTSYSTFKTVTNHFHHLDHMFGSQAFYKNMKCYEIMNFNDVILSDHAPCFLELKGGN